MKSFYFNLNYEVERIKQTNTEKKGIAMGMLRMGATMQQIADEYNVHPSTVSRWRQKLWAEGSVERKPGTGHTTKTTELENFRLIHDVKSHPLKTLTASMRDTQYQCSLQTASRIAHREGLSCHRAVCKRPLTDVMKQRRLDWAHQRVHWGLDEWSQFVFSNEKTFLS